MSEVARYYDELAAQEWERLGNHRTEFAVTGRALKDYLPEPPARIIDIGGGPGRYAIALAQQEYDVTLVDISPNSLSFAKARAAEAGVKLADCICACATDLSQFQAESFEAALLMGPLYHLLEEEERRKAICEAARLLKPGAPIFASFTTRYAPCSFAAKYYPEKLAEENRDFRIMLETGVYRPVSGQGWTHAYFAHPSEVRPLLESCGFESLDLIACEGIISMIEEKVNELTGEFWEEWVELNYRIGKDPCVHGAAEHLLYVGRKH